jgi:hypothetical protein
VSHEAAKTVHESSGVSHEGGCKLNERGLHLRRLRDI